MRIAIISDIHSNLQALQRAFEIIDAKEIDQVYCLGDIVGYGAEPNECIEILRDRGVSCIVGNHDKAALDIRQAEHLNRYARAAIEWTAKQLTPENIEFPFASAVHIDRYIILRSYTPHRVSRKSGTTLSRVMTHRSISNSLQRRYAGLGILT